MAVITMSRQFGSHAVEVAERLCQDLNLVAFDKRLMARVANEIGLSENELIDYSEDQYKQRGFFDFYDSLNISTPQGTKACCSHHIAAFVHIAQRVLSPPPPCRSSYIPVFTFRSHQKAKFNVT